jgi:hypothetical protein
VLGQGMSAEGDPPRFATVTRCNVDGGRFLLVEEPDEVER